MQANAITVTLLSFAAFALAYRFYGRFLSRQIFDRLCELDDLALARLKARLLGQDPEAATTAIGGRAARWHRAGRRIKRGLDRLRGR